MRWLRRIGLAALLLLIAAIVWEPTRVGIQTAVMLPSLLGSGPAPLNLFSDAPRRTAVEYRPGPDGEEPELAELWLPSWASEDERAGAVLLVLGVNNVGRNHPVVERVAEALARTGVAVLVPDSALLLAGRLDAGEIDGVVLAYETLAARPEVDPERVGIAGFSVGGSLALLAAGDPRIADEVRWVNAFGAFADAETYLSSVAAHAYASGDAIVDWQPSPLAREIYLQFVLDRVADADDRTALDAALSDAIIAGDRPAADDDFRDGLATEIGRLAHDLLTAASLDSARATIRAMPGETLAFIDQISPIRHLDGLAADIYLMHEVTDHHVPVVESRALAGALASTGRLSGFSEFRLFDHVQPDNVDFVAAAPELVRLLLHVRTLMEHSL